jgi:hypothetical protein
LKTVIGGSVRHDGISFFRRLVISRRGDSEAGGEFNHPRRGMGSVLEDFKKKITIIIL